MNPLTASPMVVAPRSYVARGPGITVTVSRTADGVAVRVGGEIDLHNAVHLQQPLDAAIASLKRPGVIVLDLSDVAFCDCSGLNALLRTRFHARCRGHRLNLAAASRPVGRLLDLTGTTHLFRSVHGRAV
ncbi:STAS domain-containing protein [Streptomyces virginiae]|uniref:STAS domain-containing protein n=1 Tax=Streptomyces virginiae TaxID=1961 RepID=UPI0036315C01